MCVTAFELGSVTVRVYIARDKKAAQIGRVRVSSRCHMYITRKQTYRDSAWDRALRLRLRLRVELELCCCWVSQDCHLACLPCFVAIYECRRDKAYRCKGKNRAELVENCTALHTASDKIK